MVYTFTQEELDEISAVLNEIDHLSNDLMGKYRPVYDTIIEILTDESQRNGRVTGLEEPVWIWIQGARDVNSGLGYSSYYIREYTRSQFEQRYGKTLTDKDLNMASNIIAKSFIDDVLTGNTPTINEFGAIDAAPIASSIFDEVFEQNFSGWAGTLLFPHLGISSYYKDWIINDQPVAGFKPLSGTYDLISAAAASIPLANNALAVALNMQAAFGTTGALNSSFIARSLASKTDDFFTEFYQTAKYNFSHQIGSDLFSPGSKDTTYLVGTLFDDTFSKNAISNKAVNGTAGNDIIHAGLGDDAVFASDGDDLIDGGEGDDIIDTGKGNDLVVTGQGADKIIVDEGEKTIIDGSAEDRLYFRASLVGGTPVEGEDRLIPLLGGVASYVTTIESSGEVQGDQTRFYDVDQDGNTKYWFSSRKINIKSSPIGPAIDNEEDVYEKYNLDPFAIAYEMNGPDLEIFVYKDVDVQSPFAGHPETSAQPNIIHHGENETIKIILPDFKDGQYGISFLGPEQIGTINVDGNSTVNQGGVTAHNNTVDAITLLGTLDETFGKMTGKAPITDSETGGPARVVFKSGEGDDEIEGDETDENIDGQAGDDIIDGKGGDDTIEGGIGDDIISGGEGTNTLSGGPDNDTFIGGAGADSMSGGSGTDWVFYNTSDEAVSVNLATNQHTGGHAQGDSLTDIEAIAGSNFDDTLEGNSEANILAGNQGNDIIKGGKGDDVLEGGAGADTLEGGDGLDSVSYRSSHAAVTINLANQQASGGHANGDTFTSIEGAIGSQHADLITGDQQDNILRGDAGDDTITAQAGDDLIEGGAGADLLSAGLGNDTLDYSSADAAITINLSHNLATGCHATGDQISGFENLIGSDFSDTLQGDSQTNFIDAGEGDDTIIVTGGADLLLGNWGADTLDFKGATAAISADLASSTFAGGIADGLAAFSFENTLNGDAETNCVAPKAMTK